jgi:hypothetical protein
MTQTLKPSTDETTLDQKELEALVVNNEDLEKLESLLDQFNIFEAIRSVHVEVRHSDFLSYLLNPSENHGLGDAFVKRFLQRALASSPTSATPLTPIDLDIWDLDTITVQREWQNIDLLLTDERNEFAVVIENKIDSREHNEQLQRYRKIAEQQFPDWHIIYLYLTPEGDLPSDDQYISVDYTSICEILEQLEATRASTLGPDIRFAIQHYTQMLRRNIVSESEIADLCRRIYRRHQRALDLIFEYRTDQQSAIFEIIKQLILEQGNLTLDHSSKSYIRFSLKDWNTPKLLEGVGWTRSKRILMFEFLNIEDRLSLHLIIGPGPLETRRRLHEMSLAHKPPFKPSQQALGKTYNTIYTQHFLTAKDYEGADTEKLEEEIGKKWQHFMDHDLPQISKILSTEKWIWEP